MKKTTNMNSSPVEGRTGTSVDMGNDGTSHPYPSHIHSLLRGRWSKRLNSVSGHHRNRVELKKKTIIRDVKEEGFFCFCFSFIFIMCMIVCV